MPWGEIHKEYRHRHFKFRNYWGDSRIIIIKCQTFKNVVELVKYLRKNCSFVRVSPVAKPIKGETEDNKLMDKLRKNSKGLSPLRLKGNHSNPKMVREYQLFTSYGIEPESYASKPTEWYYSISEQRNGENKKLLDNPNDVVEVIEGDLGLLNLAREIAEAK